MLKSVIDRETKDVILHDIYVAGQWVGSRRTVKQAIETLRWHTWPSAVIGEIQWYTNTESSSAPPTASKHAP